MRKPPLPKELEDVHEQAVQNGREWYRDPETSLLVKTRLAHTRRGSCCGNRCRHCPYDWENVPKGLLLALILVLEVCIASAQNKNTDTVLLIVPGTGQTSGQGAVFFPANVLSGPSTRGTEIAPDTDPREICSIGLGGAITVGYKSAVIVDGPGADFVVVENTFRYGNGRVFAEPATVEVSSDGIVWTQFPFDSLTLIGCAGRTPLGDSFDLAAVRADSIRWIRITDVSDIVLTNRSHPFWDPTISGFDLDVVYARNYTSRAFETNVSTCDNGSQLCVGSPESTTLTVYNTAGMWMWSQQLPPGYWRVDLAQWPPGMYLAVLVGGSSVQTLKVLR